MEVIIKNIDIWILLLKEIDELKDKYGSNIIHDTAAILKEIKNKKLHISDSSVQLLGLLVGYGIDDIDLVINFLYSIENIYRFESIIASLLEIKDKYGAQKLAFINNGIDKYLTIETFTTISKSRKVYFAKDIYPYVTMDFKTNGINKMSFLSSKPFIVDDIDSNNHIVERTIYTADFRLNCDTLPLKEEMDRQDIQEERDAMFISLLEHLHVMANDIDINLIKSEPNGTYLKSDVIDFNEYFTVRCDGVISDSNHNELRPGYTSTSKVLIKNANFVVIAQVINGVISEINLVVSPSYLEYIYPLLTSDLIHLLSYLEGISANLNPTRIMFK